MISKQRIQDFHEKAATLTEALPWIKSAWGKVIVIKYGGAAMSDPVLRQQVADDIVLMKFVGVHPVVVHGGGSEVTRYQEALGHEVVFKDGMRVTPPEVLDIVKMVLVGKVNKEIVNSINVHGAYAVGISGEDGGLVTGIPISAEFGRTGTVTKINTSVVEHMIADDFIPVIATIGIGEDGESINVNADLVAGKLAEALGADKCIYLTDVNGIYRDFDDKESLISVLTPDEAKAFMDSDDAADGGMIPKIKACADAVRGGVRRAHILNGTVAHSVILEVYTDVGVGTMITEEVNPL